MSNNSILELESLNKEYEFTLKQYNKAANDYMQLTQQIAETQPQPKTAQDCTDMGGSSFASCSSSGLTYCCGVCSGTSDCSSNSGLSNCACTNKYEKQEEILLKVVSKLNDTLTQLGEQITTMNQQLTPGLQQSFKKAFEDNFKLKIDLNELNVEKKKISKLLKSIKELNAGQTEGSIKVTSNYYGYIMFMFITLLCILGVVMLGSLINTNNAQKGGRLFKYNKK